MADELYLFNNNGVYAGFTPTLFKKTLGGIDYIPAIIYTGPRKLTDNFAKSPVTFYFDALNSFARSILEELPEIPIQVTIYKASLTYWTGQVKAVSRKTITTIEVICDSSFTVAVSGGQRYRMNLHCNHKVYSPQCGVVESSFQTLGTTTASSNVLTIPELTQPTGYFNGGKTIMGGQTRSIIDHNGTVVRLSAPFTGVLSGSIALYPNCLGTKDACVAFNNLPNGLFFHKQSSKNPYGNTGLL